IRPVVGNHHVEVRIGLRRERCEHQRELVRLVVGRDHDGGRRSAIGESASHPRLATISSRRPLHEAIMLQGIQALLELSKVDVQIAELEDEQRGLPAARAALDQEREKGAAAIEAAQAAVLAGEQEQRRHEAAVADREALVKKLEGQQHQVKTNDAYKGLLHEIDQARAGISDAETKILEAMEQIESARTALARARAAAKAVDERAAQQERLFTDREASVDQTLGNLRRDRATLVAGVEAPLLQRYDRIATRR